MYTTRIKVFSGRAGYCDSEEYEYETEQEPSENEIVEMKRQATKYICEPIRSVSVKISREPREPSI